MIRKPLFAGIYSISRVIPSDQLRLRLLGSTFSLTRFEYNWLVLYSVLFFSLKHFFFLFWWGKGRGVLCFLYKMNDILARPSESRRRVHISTGYPLFTSFERGGTQSFDIGSLLFHLLLLLSLANIFSAQATKKRKRAVYSC